MNLRRAFTVTEAIVAVTILAVLLAMGVPRMTRAAEQMKLDAAAMRLKAVWSAQRLYWLEESSFATTLQALGGDGLIDEAVAAGGDGDWTFVLASPSADVFVVTATRTGASWTGSIAIDESGTITGGLDGPDGVHLTAVSP